MISRKTSISAAALLIASAGAAAAFPATVTSDLNVRSGPGTGYSVVDRLEAGDTVEIVSTRGSWYQTADGGWANGSYLDAQGSVAIEPGYEVAEAYGSPAFYYGSDPYYYDDAGYYYYIRAGARHRIGDDWWHSRRDNVRWSDRRQEDNWRRRQGNPGVVYNNRNDNRQGQMHEGRGSAGPDRAQVNAPNIRRYSDRPGVPRVQRNDQPQAVKQRDWGH